MHLSLAAVIWPQFIATVTSLVFPRNEDNSTAITSLSNFTNSTSNALFTTFSADNSDFVYHDEQTGLTFLMLFDTTRISNWNRRGCLIGASNALGNVLSRLGKDHSHVVRDGSWRYVRAAVKFQVIADPLYPSPFTFGDLFAVIHALTRFESEDPDWTLGYQFNFYYPRTLPPGHVQIPAGGGALSATDGGAGQRTRPGVTSQADPGDLVEIS